MNLEAVIDKNRVRRAFSRQAPVYEENAPLQKEVARRLISMIPSRYTHPLPQGEVGAEGRVLDIGIGTGFAIREFLSRSPKAGAFGCDISLGMLTEAKKAGAVLAGADVESLPYKENVFDLIFSSLAFQWTDLGRALMETARIIKPNGNLYFATFGDKTLKELAYSFNAACCSVGIEGMPKTMKFESPQRVKALMEAAGFKDMEVKTELIKNSYRSPEALLRSLKTIGAGNPSRNFHPSRTLLQEAFRIYEERYGGEDGIPATFELVYAQGTKI